MYINEKDYQIKASWLMGNMAAVANEANTYNWYGINKNNEEEFVTAALIFNALILTGEAKQAYEIKQKYNLDQYDNFTIFSLGLTMLNNDFKIILESIENQKKENLKIIEPYDFYKPQSKQNRNQLYPETVDAQQYLKQLFSNMPGQAAIRELYNRAFIYNEIYAASALAELAFGQNNLQNAFYAFVKCTNLDPNKAFYWGEAGRVMYKENIYITSLYFLTRAIKLDRYNPHWYFTKALVYRCLMGKLEPIFNAYPELKQWFGKNILLEAEKNLETAENLIDGTTAPGLQQEIKQNISFNPLFRQRFNI